MFKRILVPLDGSARAEVALEPALHLAGQSGGRVFLLRVPTYETGSLIEPADYELQWHDMDFVRAHEQVITYLQEVRQSRQSRGVPIDVIVGEGDRAAAVVKAAEARETDLIVMTTHARTGIARRLLGSVAADVLRRASCPVLVLRRATPLAHLLITLDGTTGAETVIQPALALAKAMVSEVTLLRICEANPADKARAVAYLQTVVARYKDDGLEVAPATACGPLDEAITDFAQEHGVDLIAMATHGRSGLQRLLLGSVTENIAASATCAMLVVQAADKD